MLPRLTDLVALLGISLVLCAMLFRLLRAASGSKPWVKWMIAGCFVLLWLPVGAAHLPSVAYVRGVSSDLSLTLVALAGLGLWQGLFRSLPDFGSIGCKSAAAVHFSPAFCPIAGLWACKSGKNCPRWGSFSLSMPKARQAPSRALLGNRDKTPLFAVVLVAGVFLYPTALGWGDWDAYRLGWGSYGMLLGLLALVFAFCYQGLRLLPLLVALALLGWVAGIMESGNLWDYLIDPWLVIFAFVEYPVKKFLKIIASRRGEVV